MNKKEQLEKHIVELLIAKDTLIESLYELQKEIERTKEEYKQELVRSN